MNEDVTIYIVNIVDTVNYFPVPIAAQNLSS